MTIRYNIWKKFSFYNLSTLLFIDLSNNYLNLIHKHFIVGSEKLFFLSLENNTLEAINSKEFFKELNIKFLRIKCFSLCCYVPKVVKCSVKKPWYISCSHILGNNVIKWTFHFMSFANIVINILHLLVQSRHEGKKQSTHTAEAFDIIVISISIINMIAIVPLLILLISDLHYADNIVLVQNQWKSSIVCLISSGINVYYGIASPFLHNLLSYARYEIVKYPIDSNFKRNDYIIKIIIVGCTFILFFATVITILFWLRGEKMPNVYCSPFFDPSGEFSLDEPLAWLIIGVNFIAVSLNLIFHSKLVAEVMIYQNDYLRAKSRNQFKMSLFIQIVYITCCHLLCWGFNIIVLLISMLQRMYPIEIILLQLFIIAPLNSILIPFLFIIKKIKTLLSKSN